MTIDGVPLSDFITAYKEVTIILGGIALSVVVFVVILKLVAVLNGWPKLRASFPATAVGRVLAEYPNGIKCFGGMGFRGGGGMVKLSESGIFVHIGNPFMKDLLVPYNKIKKIVVNDLLGRISFICVVDHSVNFQLELPLHAFSLLRENVGEPVFEKGLAIGSLTEAMEMLKRKLHTP